MAAPSRREWVAVLALAAVFAAVMLPSSLHKGGDILDQMGQSERLLRGEPLFASGPGQGTHWPPFSAVLILPFALVARVSPALGQAAWGLFGVACLVASVVIARRWASWGVIGLALLAVAAPLQNNFRHLNINTVLLALLVWATDDLRRGREARASILVGLAAALKAFPALVFVIFLWQRRWRALAWGVGVTAGATYLAALRYGPLDAFATIWDWVELSVAAQSYAGAEVATLGMQKLARLGRALTESAIVVGMLHAAVAGLLVLALRGPRRPEEAPAEVGALTLSAVLLSPIAWLHSFTLAFPALVAAFAVGRGPDGRTRPAWIAAAVVAGVLLSGLLANLRYPEALAFVPRHNDSVGGLVLLGLLALRPRHDGPSRPHVPTLKGGPGGALP
jgi:glycosyl transferase family 87